MTTKPTNGEAKVAEATLKNSLNFFGDKLNMKDRLSIEFVQKTQEVKLAADKLSQYSSDILSDSSLDNEDKRRLSLGLNTRGIKTYKDKYKDNVQLLDKFKQYSKWSGALGFEPPAFSDDASGNSLNHLRSGALTDIKEVASQLSSVDRDMSAFTHQLSDALKNASEYKEVLEEELEKVKNIVIKDDDPKKDFKNNVKNITVSELEVRIDLWDRALEYVDIGENGDNIKFTGLEYVADPTEPLVYKVDKVYFNESVREYVVELLFNFLVTRSYVTGTEAINRYKIEPDILINSVEFGILLKEDSNGNLILDENNNPVFVDYDYKRIILRTKFGIIPNTTYTSIVDFPNLDDASVDFTRAISPRIKTINYVTDNEIHVRFTSDIDIDIEGIREETKLILDRVTASNIDNYKITDTLGNKVDMSHVFLEDDLYTITIILEESMENKMGYKLEVKNLFFEKGGIIKEGDGIFNFVYSDPNPILGLTGLYDHVTNVVALIWLPSTQDGMAGYNIYRKAEAELKYTKVNESVVIDEKFVDGFIENNKSYKYAVTVVDMSGDESVFSPIFSITTAD